MELKHCLDYFGISSRNMDNNLYCQIDGIVCMYVYTCVVVILVFSSKEYIHILYIKEPSAFLFGRKNIC